MVSSTSRTRQGLAAVAALVCFIALATVLPSAPAHAFIGNVIPMNENEEPTDTFTTANALVAYVTTDPRGGRVCVVPENTENPGDGSLSCDAGAGWVSPQFVSSIGSFFLPLKGPFLRVGTWRLLADSSAGERDALSIPFTVSPCEPGPGCDTTLAEEYMNRWKDAARQGREGMHGVCTGAMLAKFALQGKKGQKLIRTGVEEPVEEFVFAVALGGLQMTVFPSFSPPALISRGLGMIQDLSCAARSMYDGIIADPPDPNYEEIVTPVGVSAPTYDDPVLDGLASELSDMVAYGTAQRVSTERFQGAIADDDTEAAARQALAIADFGYSFVDSMRDTADSLRTYAADIADDEGADAPVTTQAELADTIALYERIRSDGLNEDEVQQLVDADLEADEIAAVEAAFDLDIENVPVGKTLVELVEEAAADLEAAAEEINEFSLAAGSVAAVLAADGPADNLAPTAAVTATPQSGAPPLEVAFDASGSTDADGTIASYSWDFGDGTSGSGPAPTRTYSTGGVYVATVTVTDDDGATATASTTISVDGAGNAAPLAFDQSGTVASGKTLSVSLSAADADADPLTYEIVSSPDHGSLSDCSSGHCTYTSDSGYTGPDSFRWRASDGSLGSVTATYSITVSDNAAPLAQDGTVTTREGTPASFVLSATDPDNDPLTFQVMDAPQHGDLTSCTSGSCTYTPEPGYVGPDSFLWAASDGAEESNVATQSIQVVANTAPIASDSDITVREGKQALIGFLVYDQDSDPLTFDIVDEPVHGKVTDCGPGFCTYTPDDAFVGDDVFTWRASDGLATSNLAQVTVHVAANSPPTSSDAETSLIRGTSTSLALPGVDPNGDPLTFVILDPPTHGTLTDCSNGACTYTPDAGFVGDDTFRWRASDDRAASPAADYVLHVTKPCAPGACIDNGSVLLGVNPEGHLNLTNTEDGKPRGLTFLQTGNESTAPGCLCEGWGVADAASGVTGSANVAVGGVSNLAVESFTSTDSTARSVVTVSGAFRVTHDYHPATASDQLYEALVTIENIGSDERADVRYRRVMDWDVEPTPFSEYVTIETGNSENLLYASDDGFAPADPLSGPRQILFSGPATDSGPADHGALFDFGFGALDPGESTQFKIYYGAATTEAAANAAVSAVDAEVYSFGQPSGEGGPDVGSPNTFIFAFAGVGGDPVFSPVAADDELTTDEGESADVEVLANDSDPNGDVLTVTTANPPAEHGTVSCTAAGVCTYTPDAGFHGSDSFDYTISDGEGGTDKGTVAVVVRPVNRPPTAVDDEVAVDEDAGSTRVDVLGNDTDPDGDNLTVTDHGSAAHGTATCIATGCTYKPDAGYHGSDTFTYTISDGNGGTDEGTVAVVVRPVNRPPTAVDDEVAVDEDAGSTRVDVLGNDTDPDGDDLNVSGNGNADHGTVACTPTGCTYTPNANYHGADAFTYTVSDGSGPEDQGTVMITVRPVNDSPVAADDEVTIEEDSGASSLRVLDNDSDPDGDTLSVVGHGDAAHGTVDCTARGCTYTPSTGYRGQDTFTYVASDGHLESQPATVLITVNPAPPRNRPPVATPQELTVDEDGVLDLTLSGSDPDGDELTFTLTSGTHHGTLSGTAPRLTYQPDPDFVGIDSLSFTVGDGSATSEVAVVSIHVRATNDAPVVTVDSGATGVEGAPVQLSAAAEDVDGDALQFAWTADPATGVDSAATCSFSASQLLDTAITCNDDGVWRITFSAGDGRATTTASHLLTISNAAPTVAVQTPAMASVHDVGAVVSLTATITDPGANDALTCAIDWGDGNSAAGTLVDGRCTGTHAYDDVVSSTIVVSATDDDGETGSASTTILIAGPSKKATGGGKVTASGQITFGFVVQGVTELRGALQLNSSSVTFHGDTVNTYRRSGSSATWSGTGHWNRSPGYSFTTTVIDGGTDKRGRLKPDSFGVIIKNPAGSTVYTTNGTKTVTGGNLVLHR